MELSSRFLAFITLLVLALVPLRSAALNEIFATDLVDEVVGLDGQFSLREAINLANQDMDETLITLLPGETYDLSLFCGDAPEDENASGDLDHLDDHDLIIQGDASGIRQTCDGRGVLEDHAGSGRLRLEGVSLLAGEFGLRSGRETYLVDVQVLGNATGASISGDDRIPVTIVDSSFNLNTLRALSFTNVSATLTRVNVGSNSNGLGIANSAVVATELNVLNNTFWGILLDLGSLEIVDGDVSGNRTGILAADFDRLDIQQSDIRGNGMAGEVGGGIRVTGNGTFNELRIDATAIRQNRSSEPGAGLFVDVPPGTQAPIVITKSSFSENVSGPGADGGAIAIRYAPTRIDFGFFGENRTSSGGDGGGIHYLGPGVLVVREGLFLENVADAGSGGALSVAQGSLELSGSELSNNRAAGGGAVHATGGIVRISDSQLQGNRAESGPGGAVSVASTLGSAASLEMIRSTAGQNFSATSGAVFLNDAPGHFENATVFLNVSGSSFGVTGTGVQAINASPIEFRFASIVANQGPAGSAQAATDDHLTIVNSVLDGPVPACASPIVSTTGGYNVVRDASCPVSVGAGDLVAPSGLGLPDYTSGVPRVLVPNGASVLVGRVPVGACDVATDARGVTRPQGVACDTGAAERIDGGVAGIPPAFFLGFDQPGMPVEAVSERLGALGIEVLDPDQTSLAQGVLQSGLILAAPGASTGALGALLRSVGRPIVTWGADQYLALGMVPEADTTHRRWILMGQEKVEVTTRPAELAVCGPEAGEPTILATFAAPGRAAFCIYDTGDTLESGEAAPGPRVGVSLNPEFATEAGWSLFDEAIALAVATPEGP